jgi:hypothetical protein
VIAVRERGGSVGLGGAVAAGSPAERSVSPQRGHQRAPAVADPQRGQGGGEVIHATVEAGGLVRQTAWGAARLLLGLVEVAGGPPPNYDRPDGADAGGAA